MGTYVRERWVSSELDYDDEAVYVLLFEPQAGFDIFIEALKAESIPYGTIPDREKHTLVLFYSDLLVFIMKAAIGL